MVIPQGRIEKRKIIFLSQRAIEEEGNTQPQKQVNVHLGNSLQGWNNRRTMYPVAEVIKQIYKNSWQEQGSRGRKKL